MEIFLLKRKVLETCRLWKISFRLLDNKIKISVNLILIINELNKRSIYK